MTADQPLTLEERRKAWLAGFWTCYWRTVVAGFVVYGITLLLGKLTLGSEWADIKHLLMWFIALVPLVAVPQTLLKLPLWPKADDAPHTVAVPGVNPSPATTT